MVRSKIPMSLLGSLVFFLVLWLLDFPKPHTDDLSYIGAALNLANGGDFSDPFLAREFTEHYAFFYPPIHSFVLAGWLKVFGISAASLTGFQALLYLLCAGAAIFILRKHEAPVWLEWLVPLAAGNAFVWDGLRPEPLAAALIIVGFALIECGVRNKAGVFLAFFLIVLGGEAAPRMTLYAAALILFALWRICSPPAMSNRERWTTTGLFLAAGGLAGLLFLAMIQFKVKEFWETFHENAQRVSGGNFASALREHFGLGQVAIGTLLVIAGFFICRQKLKDDLVRISLTLALVFPLEFLARFTGHYSSRWYALLVCLFLFASLWKRTPVFWRTPMQIGLCAALLFLNLALLVNVLGMLSGRIERTDSSFPPPSQPGHAIFLDGTAARYYFNYRIPRGYLDFFFPLPFPAETPLTGAHPNDLYLIGADDVDFLENRGGGLDYQPMAKWTPPGIPELSFYKYPRQVFIIPASLCKGLPMETNLADQPQ